MPQDEDEIGFVVSNQEPEHNQRGHFDAAMAVVAHAAAIAEGQGIIPASSIVQHCQLPEVCHSVGCQLAA